MCTHAHDPLRAIRLIAIPWSPSTFSPSLVHADATAIVAGSYHSMVLKQDGTVWATGRNHFAWLMGGETAGQLGDGTTTSKQTFVKVVSSGQCVTMVWTPRHHIH